ncbi:undecaprenyl diphosphate synthase family protein [Candidatus Woesearchaeota archaeon]|nr:undecaprenyl diphosphate synthase family protein [Candidatus Woesearchaeota archaeon]
MVGFKHVAVSLFSPDDDATDSRLGMKRQSVISGMMHLQSKLGIPVVSVFLLPLGSLLSEDFPALCKAICEIAHVNRAKISVLGKWYNLSGRHVDAIKMMIEETKDYDRLFFNLCLNYDGREEIIDSCRIIALKVKSDRLAVESISQDILKENIYSSYFIPPDLIIKTGEKRLDGFLLWDSANSMVYFTGKHWSELAQSELRDIVESRI